MTKILFTGASGLLGKYLLPLLAREDGDGTLYPRVEIETPSHKDLDITQPYFTYAHDQFDYIIHAAAYTDVPRAEIDRKECFETNLVGTMALLSYFENTPMIYISSEYAHNPVNYYSETKAAAEAAVKAYAQNYLIIRTLFKPTPFPFAKAFTDQFTQGDSVDVIAPLLAKKIIDWDRKNKTVYVGTGRKTMFDLAKQTKPDVQPCSVKDIADVKLPEDYL